MRRQADSVPGPVDEPLAVARIGDHPAGGAVDLLARDPGPHGLEAGLLGALDDLVHVALLVGRLAHVHRARRVRAVTVHDPAEVEDDHVALLDHARSELVVRVGAVRPRADEGELDLRVAVCLQGVGEVRRDLGLLPAGEAHLEDVVQRGVCSLSGGRESLELVRILDRP